MLSNEFNGDPVAQTPSVDLFYSYSHRDEELLVELDGHLSLLRRRGVLRTWYDRRITAGDDWRRAIDEHLMTADIVLLLVSADFMSSDYCHDREMSAALQRHENGECVVIPVLVRHLDWEGAKFSHLEWLPTNMQPVTNWQNRDEAWTNVAKAIRRTVEHLIDCRRLTHRSPVTVTPQILKAEQYVFKTLEKRISQALEAKGKAPRPQGDKFIHSLRSQLADIQAQKRILWVDDAPLNNTFEIAALRGLQIEVQTSSNTEEALSALEEAERNQEPYDLVLSDWTRFPMQKKGRPEGLRLLRLMRARQNRTPVIFYHGEFNPKTVKQRLSLVVKNGGTGAANLPDDLLRQVAETLAGSEST